MSTSPASTDISRRARPGDWHSWQARAGSCSPISRAATATSNRSRRKHANRSTTSCSRMTWIGSRSHHGATDSGTARRPRRLELNRRCSLPGVISPQAATIRAGIVRAAIDSSVSVLDERNAWEAAAAATPLPEWATEELVEVGGVACRLVRADGVSDSAPTIVYNHGGGFVSGSSLTTRVFGARLSARTGAVVVLVDYRLLPEHPFPAPLDDVVAVARACAANGRGEVLWLGGDSSGA